MRAPCSVALEVGEFNRSSQHSFKCEVLCMSSKKQLIEKQAEFWVLMAQGSTLTAACEAVGVNRRTGGRWRQGTGGLIPRKRPPLSGRYLSLDERLQIADLHLDGQGVRAIAGQLGRRPKASKFDHVELATVVQAKLCVKWSPEQISLHLAKEFPDRAEMNVCPETIYQALFVQGRGHLRADLHKHLRTGRAVRRPQGSTGAKSAKISDMVMISERPAEVADRAVPGHWEGDLILGSNCRSAIGTLVERQTRYTMLVHLPGDHSATTVRDALMATIATLPEHLRKSLTWDQGTELAKHREITMATKMAIYFCDPHSPWQRGSNENTNGLLRQYFPKGTDLSVHPPGRLLEVATELNARPRKTLGGITPAQAMHRLIFNPEIPIVATTA